MRALASAVAVMLIVLFFLIPFLHMLSKMNEALSVMSTIGVPPFVADMATRVFITTAVGLFIAFIVSLFVLLLEDMIAERFK